MDIVIEKHQRKPYGKRHLVLGLLAAPLIVAGWHLWPIGRAEASIDKDGLVISEVQRGDFKASVRGTGVLVPENIQWLTAEVEATVEKVVAKAGNVVKQGDLIAVLSNPRLVQELEQARWELEAQEAEAKAGKVAQRLELLGQEAAVANYKMNYESKLLRKTAQEKLLATHAVSRLDHEQTVLETAQFKERWSISQQQLEEMRQNVVVQDNARTAKVNQARKQFESINERVENLQVKATMDSIVLERPLEVGQRIVMGDNIAKLAQQGALIAELRVPEIQIRDVVVGQHVVIDTRNSKIQGKVARIEPAVVNGHVQVDVAFSETLPSDARPDLSVDGEIVVAQFPDTLYVNRPLFGQSRSRSTFYKLTDNGRVAVRVKVLSGYGSVNKLQIIEGLQLGDRIITSDPTRFEMYERVRLN